jgi:hypothetical protein
VRWPEFLIADGLAVVMKPNEEDEEPCYVCVSQE